MEAIIVFGLPAYLLALLLLYIVYKTTKADLEVLLMGFHVSLFLGGVATFVVATWVACLIQWLN
jgi:hypothetical protein